MHRSISQMKCFKNLSLALFREIKQCLVFVNSFYLLIKSDQFYLVKLASKETGQTSSFLCNFLCYYLNNVLKVLLKAWSCSHLSKAKFKLQDLRNFSSLSEKGSKEFECIKDFALVAFPGSIGIRMFWINSKMLSD